MTPWRTPEAVEEEEDQTHLFKGKITFILEIEANSVRRMSPTGEKI
jgi:hypothetical protein